MSELLIDAYRYLVAQPEIISLAPQYLGSDTQYPAWVFRAQDGDPGRAVEGSGKCAIVLSANSFWAVQNMHNTAQFPVLRVVIYADNTRNAAGVALGRDAADRALHIYDAVNKILHDPGKDISRMGATRIHDIVAGGSFVLQEMPDSDGCVFGIANYNITTD